MADLWGTLTTSRITDGHDDPLQGYVAARRHRRQKVYGSALAAARAQQPIVIDVKHLLWQLDAACAGMDRELFFDSKTPVDTLRAICDECPVQSQCLAYAEEHRLLGYWGGTTEEDRGIGRSGRKARA